MNTFKVGDIVTATYRYGQVIPYFWRVEEVKQKSVVIVELQKKTVAGGGWWWNGRCVPTDEPAGAPVLKRVNKDGTVNTHSKYAGGIGDAVLWDGQPRSFDYCD